MRAWYGAWLISMALCGMASAQFITESSWDRHLPEMRLDNLAVRQPSIEEAWQLTQNEWGFRSILCGAPGHPWPKKEFAFANASATVKDFLDALCQTYDGQWQHDERTGIIWIFPKGIEYASLLAQKVRVEGNILARPMTDGILRRIQDSQYRDPEHPQPEEIRGSFYVDLKVGPNTFNYAVALKEGTYSLRDILNLCAVRHPSITFFIGEAGVCTPIIPLLITRDNLHFSVSQGMLDFLTHEAGRLKADPNNEAEMAAMAYERMATGLCRERRAAQDFVLASTMHWPMDRLLEKAQPSEAGAWVALALVDNVVRKDVVIAGMDTRVVMSRAQDAYFHAYLTPERLSGGDAKTVLLAGLELYRASFGQVPEHILPALHARKFTPEQLQGTEFEVARIASYNEDIRKMLIDPADPNYIDTGGFCDFLKAESKIYMVKPGMPPAP